MVRFENVGLRYGLGPEVLRDLTFHIEPHSFQFLTGPSGAGKSSLLRLLFLSLKPTRGLISVFGHDIATLSKDSRATLRRRIGIVFQDFRLLDHMSTFENVALPLRVLGRAEASYRHEVSELLSSWKRHLRVANSDLHHSPVVVGARVRQHRLGLGLLQHIFQTGKYQAAVKTVLAGVTSRQLLVGLGNPDESNVGPM